MVLKDGAFLTLMGLAIGLPLALLVSVALRLVFVDVGGVDVVVLTVASIFLAASVTVAGAVPARRATKVQALTALRTEVQPSSFTLTESTGHGGTGEGLVLPTISQSSPGFCSVDSVCVDSEVVSCQLRVVSCGALPVRRPARRWPSPSRR